MTKSNHSVKFDLVKVGTFEFEHELDATFADGISDVDQLLVVGSSAKARLHKVLAVLDEVLP